MRHPDLVSIFQESNIVKHHGPYCAMHRCFTCSAGRATVHVAGTECPAWSAQGKRDGMSGDRVLTWMVWVGQRRLLQEPVVLHENVGEFPLHQLQTELGDLIFNALLLGHVLARDFGIELTTAISSVREKVMRRSPHVFPRHQGASLEPAPTRAAAQEIWNREKEKEF